MTEHEPIPDWVKDATVEGTDERERAEEYIEKKVLSLEEAEASQRQAKLAIQEIADHEIGSPFLTPDGERLPMTDTEREKMDQRLTLLGQLMKDANIRWHLDGALNISLYRDEYIGVHKDIDVTIDGQDTERLDAYLSEHEYGLFLVEAEDNPAGGFSGKFRRVDGKRFREAVSHKLIAAIDEHGEIQRNAPLNFIDVRLPRRNADGAVLGYADVVLPQSWEAGRSKDFHGEQLRLSHPAEVAYHKLHLSRSYDLTDMKILAAGQVLTEADMNDLERLIVEEEQSKMLAAEAFVDRMLDLCQPTMSQEQVEIKFLSDPDVNRRIESGLSTATIKAFARVFHQHLTEDRDTARTIIVETIVKEIDRHPRQQFGILKKEWEAAQTET
ncbi:MAG: hypothetical protein AAB402_01775 [Patescibacteria group bacterium]